jgi:hypothetical protein
MNKDNTIKIDDNSANQSELALRRGKIMSLRPNKIGISRLPNPPISMGIIIKKIMNRP